MEHYKRPHYSIRLAFLVLILKFDYDLFFVNYYTPTLTFRHLWLRMCR